MANRRKFVVEHSKKVEIPKKMSRKPSLEAIEAMTRKEFIELLH